MNIVKPLWSLYVIMGCTGKIDIYKDASWEYKGGVFDLAHEYSMLGHYFKSQRDPFTCIDAIWVTCLTNLKYHK